MKNFLKFPSLVQQYIAFCVAIMMVSIGISLFFSYVNFKNFSAYKDFEFKKESIQLQHKIDEKIYYVENMIKYLANLLVKSDNYSYANISYLIQNQEQKHDPDVLTTPVIDYIDTKGRMIIDSIEGIRKVPIIVNGIRNWIYDARMHPWKIHFTEPDYGLITGEYVIPMGLAIADDGGAVRGFLSLGIGIRNLIDYLQRDLNENFNIILLSKGKNFIYSSDKKFSKKDLTTLNQHLIKMPIINSNQPSKIKKPFVLNSSIFTHYINSDKYPFTIVLGEDLNSYYDSFRDEIIFLIIKNIFLGIFSSLVLLIFSYQIIKPILELGKNAKDISEGKDVKLKKYPTEELNILSEQLKSIQTINKDLCTKQALLTKTNNKLLNANNFIKSNMSFMTHELKNPILSLVDFSNELVKKRDSLDEKEQHKYIDMINKIANYQNKQVDYFLQLFKFQETGKKIEKEPVDLEELIYWSISMMKHLANQKNIKIITDIMPSMPKMIGDKIMIGQLIQNLVSNGIKYNNEGGTLKIKVFIRHSNYKREIIMRFEDSGSGIDKKDIKKLFKKFERIKNKEYSTSFGYGIGLSYVKACVASHDGEIFISTRAGQGTAFTIVFPKSRILIDYS